MEPIFQQDFQVQDMCVDRYGRLKPSTLLYFAQEIAGRHCDELADTLESHRLFWAVTRHRVQINRLPERVRPSTLRPGLCQTPTSAIPAPW